MRGKATQHNNELYNDRITPAYAGKSVDAWAADTLALGSPLRMRGKAHNSAVDEYKTGITPAYAGKRLSSQLL